MPASASAPVAQHESRGGLCWTPLGMRSASFAFESKKQTERPASCDVMERHQKIMKLKRTERVESAVLQSSSRLN